MSFDSKNIRLLVFDWDGTLMDSIGPIVACTQTTIRELGLGELPEKTIRGTIGLGLRETIDILSPGCGEELYGEILECYRKHWVATYRDVPPLFAGVEGMLRGLAEDGYLLAVATGKSRRGLEYALAQTGLHGIFHATRTVDEAFSKPHPQMLLDILDDLGVPPAEAVMIGDTTYDLEMAKNARTPSIGVCTGSHGREELESFGPVVCLDQVVDLAAWLAGRAAAEAPLGAAARR
ncbi:MAG TPA: HAD-IA family hydrolase [Thermoanaerobaculia bacterium]|nr:HAD-IA family hydrolase [Thermoanaerobaculia bacterium]